MRIEAGVNLTRFVRDLKDTGEFSREGRRYLIERINKDNWSLKRFIGLYGLTFLGTLGSIFYVAYKPDTGLLECLGVINVASSLPVFYSLFSNNKNRDYFRQVKGVASQQRHLRHAAENGCVPRVKEEFTLDNI